MSNKMDEEVKGMLLKSQKTEITEHFIYSRLSRAMKDKNNREVLKQIANDELKHYHTWRKYTEEDVKPDKFKLFLYVLISRLFGLTFGVKLMEKGEEKAQLKYEKLMSNIPESKKINEDEHKHEQKLIAMIDEEKLKYVGSIVLGLNDALVELTGALAGFTLALQRSNLVAMTGLITGLAASLSMGASEYLSKRSEGEEKHPLKSSVYTGIAYIFTVFFLIFPFFVLDKVFFSLAWTLTNAVIIILLFTFYISVAKDLPFRRRFLEMAFVSLGVAAISFGIGFLVRIFLGVDV